MAVFNTCRNVTTSSWIVLRAGALRVFDVAIRCTRCSWTSPGVMVDKPMLPKNGNRCRRSLIA